MPELPSTLLPHYRIDGWIATLGALRIGDGGESNARIDRKKTDGQPVPVQTISTDHNQCAYLPASSVRGFLRSYAQSRVTAPELLKALFGYQGRHRKDQEFADSLGGLLTIWDAPADIQHLPSDVSEPFWNPSRATCVASHVVLDRDKRVAAEELLFFEEYVPAGIRFRVTFLIEGGQMNGFGSSDFAAVLLQLLDELRDSSARLGASNAAGCGNVAWKLDAVRQLTPEALRKWIQQPGTPLLDHYETTGRPSAPNPEWFESAERGLRFNVDLRLPGPFLVNDDSHAKQPGEHTLNKPDRFALRSADNVPLLPASSIHGALRAQAERIARTIAGERAEVLVTDPSGAKGSKPATVHNTQDLAKLDAVSCLFGSPGWRSPLRLTTFDLVPAAPMPEPIVQEFVAIDRFTGGGADERKFNAEPFIAGQPEGFTLRGVLTLDIAALDTLAASRAAAPEIGSTAAPGWEGVLWLLKYVLRDLEEGDITLGSGRSKGYGACTAIVTQAPLTHLPKNSELNQALTKLFPQAPQARSAIL